MQVAYRAVRRFFLLTTCHPLAWVGTIMATFGAIFSMGYMLTHAYTSSTQQYFDILFLTITPVAFFGGLTLIPLGIYYRHKKFKEEGKGQDILRSFEESLGDDGSLTSTAAIFGFFTFINVVITAVLLFSSYEYMESNEFCGTTCHVVMEPEYVAYQDSAHARVHCVDCHIGPGTTWFVRSKLSGTRQLWNVAIGSYSRPIPAPIEHLRPSRETCEQCHWPEKFHGEKLRVIEHFKEDKENSKIFTVLLLKVGSPESIPGKPAGVHWHIGQGTRISYISNDDKREKIPWVRWEKDDGEVVDYLFTGSNLTKEEIETSEKREMECIDCHNRPAHRYLMPEEALEREMRANVSLQEIPYFKKASMEVLKLDFSEGSIQEGAVGKSFRENYLTKNYGPALPKEELQSAADVIQKIFRRNVWPRMNIDWGSYPFHGSHINSPGCFRCHDNNHRSKDGQAIGADCRTCHTILAIDEENPDVMAVLK